MGGRAVRRPPTRLSVVLSNAEHAVLDLATEDAFGLWDLLWYLRAALGLEEGPAREVAVEAVTALALSAAWWSSSRPTRRAAPGRGSSRPEPASMSGTTSLWRRPDDDGQEVLVAATAAGERVFRRGASPDGLGTAARRPPVRVSGRGGGGLSGRRRRGRPAARRGAGVGWRRRDGLRRGGGGRVRGRRGSGGRRQSRDRRRRGRRGGGGIRRRRGGRRGLGRGGRRGAGGVDAQRGRTPPRRRDGRAAGRGARAPGRGSRRRRGPRRWRRAPRPSAEG